MVGLATDQPISLGERLSVDTLSDAEVDLCIRELGGAWAPSPDYGKSLKRDYLRPLRSFEIADPYTFGPNGGGSPGEQPAGPSPGRASDRSPSMVPDVIDRACWGI